MVPYITIWKSYFQHSQLAVSSERQLEVRISGFNDKPRVCYPICPMCQHWVKDVQHTVFTSFVCFGQHLGQKLLTMLTFLFPLEWLEESCLSLTISWTPTAAMSYSTSLKLSRCAHNSTSSSPWWISFTLEKILPSRCKFSYYILRRKTVGGKKCI